MLNPILNNKFIAFLKLIRVENLLMIALTQYLLRYFVLSKILADQGISLGLSSSLFSILVLSTILIAAAGYIINDYFDVKTDLINHPDTVVIGRVIKRRWAIILHLIFTIAGLLLGLYCALKTGYLRLAAFHIVAPVLLWFYSIDFKKRLLLGNVIVSLLTASVAFIPMVYEIGVLQHIQPGFSLQNKVVIVASFKIIGIFSVFSFISSMAREIIKDMEDYKGDKETGGYTMPIYWGIQAGKITAFFLILIIVMLLLFVSYNTYKTYRTLLSTHIIYIVSALILPMLFLMRLIIKSNTQKQFKKASLLLKLIMLMGLTYSIIYYYN
jgi:4-hydroxybenzoate polyprenyltransferase